VTRKKSSPPHQGPYLSFGAGESAFEDPESGTLLYAFGRPLSLHARIVESDLAREPEGRLSLRSLDDRPLRELGRLDARKQPRIEAALVLDPGNYRLVVQGKYRDARGKKRSFVRRGPVLRVRSPDFLDSLAQEYGPPRLPEGGIPVGVFAEGYGGPALLEALGEASGLAPFPVRRLTPALLEAVRVLVVPQPRQRSAFGRSTRLALREWVEEGGRLLVTHDMVGIRGLLSVVPEICRRGTGFPRSRSWRVVASHPAVAGLPEGLQTHSYYDHITLEPGPAGEVLAEDEEGRPVLVVGRFGRGKYAALGLIPGLAPDDRETMPEGAERRLVESLVWWLAGDP